jgi:hypothetical protein
VSTFAKKTVLATALMGAGLAALAPGAAMADEGHGHDRGHERHDAGQRGVVNVDDIQTIVPVNVCGNNVPVNVAGVQVPIQDVAANLPILSGSEIPVISDLLGLEKSDHGSNTAGNSKSCSNGVAAAN